MARNFQKRNRFILRLICLTGYCFLFGIYPGEEFFIINTMVGWFRTYFIWIFIISLTIIFFLFKINKHELLFCGITAYSLQHIASNFANIVRSITNPNQFSSLGIITESAIILIICVPVAIILSSQINQKITQYYNPFIMVLSFILLLIVLVTSQICKNILNRDLYTTSMICIYENILCVVCVILQLKLYKEKQLIEERIILENLLYEQSKHHEFSKDGIELINIKLHDLKKQLNDIKSSNNLTTEKQRLTEIQKSLEEYENIVDTGNKTLDVILMERNRICVTNDIKISCIIDGECLAFIAPTDIYSLFGNALDNAIECTLKEAKQNRIIKINVKKHQNFLLITIENFHSSHIITKDGLPITTKDDERYHGYGIKSIKFVAEKYSGSMHIESSHNVFQLTIVIPIPNDHK